MTGKLVYGKRTVRRVDGFAGLIGEGTAAGRREAASKAREVEDGKELEISETEDEELEEVRRDGKDGCKPPRSKEDVEDIADRLSTLGIDGASTEKSREDEQTSKKSTMAKTRKTARQKQTAQDAKQQSSPDTPSSARKLKAVVVPQSNPMALPTPDPTPDPDDPYVSYVAPLLSLQSFGKAIIPFREWSATLVPHFSVAKIAEASYSEVYRLSALNATSRSMKESVLKLVPLRSIPEPALHTKKKNTSQQPRTTRNPDAQHSQQQLQDDAWKSHVADVHSEVKLLQNLNDIPGFTNFRELTVLQGRPSKAFGDAWKAWNKARPRGKKSEFPDPSKRASYAATQLWAVVEMQDAGTDLDKVMALGGLRDVWQAWDVFWGVCLSVAKAEEDCRFEHRDLHLENICIRSSRSDAQADLLAPVVRDPLRRKLGFTGLETTVIDYTLSRADVEASLSESTSSSSSSRASSSSSSSPVSAPHDQAVAFLDLSADPTLFTGDASLDYQYEIYRLMRSAVLYGDPLAAHPPSHPGPRAPPASHIRFDDDDAGRAHARPSPSPPTPKASATASETETETDTWRAFHPQTNLLWTHFILSALLAHLGAAPSPASYTVDAAAHADPLLVERKAAKLHAVLRSVARMVAPAALGRGEALGSVKELVVLAMEKRWLGRGDVAGGGVG